MVFVHKNIRLPADHYRGPEWYFVTFCCENREKIFHNQTLCNWFMKNLQSMAPLHRIAVHAYCLMPDHIHLLLQGLDVTSDLLKFLKALKQKTGFEYKQTTGKHLWQKKSYDRILRRNEAPDSVAWYIWLNPVRAGLCRSAREFPWSGSLTGTAPKAALPVEPWTPPWKSEKRPPEGGRYALEP
jgi:putative transposase